MDMQVRAVRQGWLPFYPQFPENPLDVVKQARAEGADSAEKISSWVADRLKNKEMKFSVEDPDAEENWPRVWFIWREPTTATTAGIRKIHCDKRKYSACSFSTANACAASRSKPACCRSR